MATRLIGKSRSLRDALLDVRDKYDLRLQELVSEQVDRTIDDLRSMTPKDTGAGAGTTQGARRNMYRTHPGFGMRIGNNEGDTGWQGFKLLDVRRWGIINPMWDPYLRRVNYEHPTDGNFLERAMDNLRDRLAKLRRA